MTQSVRQTLARARELTRGLRALQSSMMKEKDPERRKSLLHSMVHDTKLLQDVLESQVGRV